MENQLCRLYKSIEEYLPTKGCIQRSLVMVFAFMLGGISLQAQLGTYTFSGTALCPNNATSVTTQPTGATFSSYSNIGATCSASSSTYQTTNLNTTTSIDLTQYNQFTITANSGYLLTLTSLTFAQYVSANNNPTGSTWEVRSSIDGYSSILGTGTATTSTQTPVISLPAGQFTNIAAVTFRIYVISIKLSGTTWDNDDVSLSGQVNQIPADPGNPTSNSPQCFSPGVTLTRNGTPPSGVTWYWQNTTGGTSTASSGSTYVVNTSGTYYITARNNTSLLWSTGEGSLAVTITPNVGPASFTLGSTSTRCQGAGSVTYTATATNTSGITYSLDAASITGGNSIVAATGVVTYAAGWSGTTTITASAAGCSGPTTATHTVTTTATVGTPVFTLGATSTRCQAAGGVTYTATATTTTGITYTLDATSTAAGNSIVSTTGAVTYVAGWSGTSIITASAAGCNGPASANHTVTVTPTLGTPVFSLGSTSTRCIASGNVTYTATATNTTGITYSLDAASISGGNSIVAATGVVTYAAAWTGTSTITASAAGCNGPASATHTVITNPVVTTPVFSLGATSTRCQGAGSVTYTATASNTTGITYSLDAASITGGNSIVGATGAVTYAAGWSGTTTITASAAGCSGPATSTHTVTTTPTVGTPVFSSGATSTRCIAAGSVTYTATATNNTGITYSLDATSTAAGNSVVAATGAVTYVASWSGTSTITASAAGCNGPSSATHTVTTNPVVGTPVFSLGSTSTRCQGAGSVTYTATATNTTGITYSLDAASVSGGNSIVAATGVVTYSATWAGTSTITASAAGCSGPATATHTVTITPTVGTPVFTLGSASTRCQGAGSVTYTATATNNTGITYSLDATSVTAGNSIVSATGAVTYVAGWSGTSTITASAAGCSGPKTATHTVTVTPTVGTPVFSLGSTSTRCIAAGSVTYTASATNTTGITYSLDATSTAAGNSIVSATGAVTYVAGWSGASTITASATGCNGPSTATHTVTTNPAVTTPIFSSGSTSTRCQGAGSVTYTATASNNTGITYSLDATSTAAGNSIVSTTGVVTYVAGWSGTSTITVSAAGCSGPKTANHTVTITPTVGTPVFSLGSTSTRCQGAGSVTYAATATNNTGITYSLDATSVAAGNSIVSATGAVTYVTGWSGTSTITASATGCNGPSTANHTVTVTPTVGTPVFSLGSTSTRCIAAGSVTYTASATNTTGITYSLDATSTAAGNSIVSTSGAVTCVAGWSGTSTITASAAGCNGPAAATHTVNTNPAVTTPVFSSGSTSTRCQGTGSVTYTATANNTTGITYTLDATSTAAGNSIVGATGAVTYAAGWSGTSTITVSAAGCSGPKTATHTVTITPTVGTPVFTLGSSSSRCIAAGSVTYTASATNTTGISYSLDATSTAAGNSIVSATGAVTYVAGWSGASTITASATGCNGPSTATHTVTTNPTLTTPVFSMGTNSGRCIGVGSVTYTATATDATSITYSLDAASLAANNTINAATGAVSYKNSWSGTSIITASAAGCNGPALATHSAASTNAIGAPVFTLGSTSTRCQGAGSVTYSATATNASGITYTLDAASVSGGNTINSSNGSVTWAADWSGTTTITAVADGCSGPTTNFHTVTITATVGTPVFTLGATTTRCQGAGTVTYSATATTNTGLTFSLDATSISGGNTIISTTGAVTYVAGWSGTSIVTASATGCSGPKTATHTVTVTPTVGTPVFSLGATSTRCQAAGTVTYTATNNTGISYSLDATSTAAGNSINSATGTVTYLVGYTGTSIITTTSTGCNGPKTSSHTITTNPYVTTPVFTAGASSTRCQGSNSVVYTATANNTTGITYSIDATSTTGGNAINVATGAVTWAAGWNGTTTVTATAAGCSGPTTANHTVTTTATVGTPVFTLGTTSTRCRAAGTVTYTATANTNTGITYSLDAGSLAAGNTINTTTGAVTFVEPWDGTSVITASATGCNGPSTATHTVTTTPYVLVPVFGLGGSTTRCQAGANVTYTATATYATSIIYSIDAVSLSAGNSINSSTGVNTYNLAYSGTTYITATANGCGTSQSSVHTATTTATVGPVIFAMGATSTVCQNPGTITYTASATTTSGITYTLSDASLAGGNTIDANTGAVTYSPSFSGTSIVTANAAGCSGPTTATHTVTVTATVGAPIFSLGSSSTRCQAAGTVTYTATATTNTGLSYSLDGTSTAAGNSINSATGLVTYLVGYTGRSIITATATGCNGPAIATHTVTTTPYVGTPVFALGSSSTRCQGAVNVTYTASATDATSVTYTLDNTSKTAGNSIDLNTGVLSWAAGWTGSSTITATATGCSGPKTATHTITTTATVGTPVFTLGATSSRCNGAGTVTYTATATTTTGITYTLDATSTGGGNTINASTGAVTYAAGWSGTAIITASAAGCNGPAIATHTVTVTPNVGVPVFVLGSSSIRCQAAATVTYTAAASDMTGISYTLDLLSRTNGNTINAATGTVTYVAGWTGTSTITATATGCGSNTTATHTVTTNGTIGTPTFSMGSSSTRCQGAATVTYTASSTNATSMVYSLNAPSIAAGNTINASTGAVTYTAGYSGTTIVTITAGSCGGPKTATHTVTVTASVGAIVFTLGTSSNRCRGNGTVSYAATATTNTGISYSLDANSILAGITINSSTGDVSYTNGYSGTVYITATASGCNGPSTGTHAATSYGNLSGVSFSAGSTSARCQGVESITYTASAGNMWSISYNLDNTSLTAGNTINTSNGQVTYVPNWFGTSIITATVIGCNGPKSATDTIVTAATIGTPVFNLGATSTRCKLAGNGTYTATAANTTAITYSLDGASLSAGNIINASTGVVTYTGSWFGTSVITVTANGCGGPKTATHTVTINDNVATPVFAAGTSFTTCQGSGTLQFLATAYANQGINYSIDLTSRNSGNNAVQLTGEVIFVNNWSGTTTLTATALGCAGPQSANFTIVTTPFVTTPVFAAGSSSIKCQGAESITYTATANYTNGIVYKLDSASLVKGNTIDTLTGNVTFAASFTGSLVIKASANGCSGPKVATHTMLVTSYISTPVFDFGATSTRCQGGATVTYTATATGDALLTYSLDSTSRAAGNLINTSTGAITYNGGYSGTSIITVVASGCGGPFSARHTVTITPTVGTPVFAAGTTSSRCRGAGSNTYTATSTNSTGLTYSLDGASISGGNTINSTSGLVAFAAAWAGTSTITATTTGCNGPDFSTHVVSTRADVATPVFVLGSTSVRCQSAGDVTYTATASNSTGITYALDNNSVAAGNTIDSTGTVTYVNGWSGTTTITALAAGCSGPTSSNHVVTITTAVSAPVFVLGASSSRCNSAGNVVYTANAGTAISYSLDNASIAGGNTINSSTGSVFYVAGWVGATQIIATAAGCGTPSTIHDATSTPNVATPAFSLGSTSTRCQGASSSTYAATAAYSTSLIYSIDALSASAGTTINSTNGSVSFGATWAGNTTITVTATGCNGPSTASHVVTISGNGTPSFALGTTSTRTQAAETITYTATANNGTAVSYSLDASSLSAGLTVNSTTGAVTYTNVWSGVTTITASANGCIGVVSATHTVTSYPSSVFKQLYLSDPSQALDRIDPVATADATTAITATIASGGSVTFTQAPALCSQLIVKVGRNITVTAYVNIISGSMPANPTITAVLKYGTTNIISLSSPTYNSTTGLLTWTGTLSADVTVPAGQAIVLVITSAQAAVSFSISYDSQTKPSMVEIPVSTFISIASLNVYDAAYPGGNLVTNGVSGTTKYIRAVVSDPFGFSDINGLNITITPPNATYAATSVATAGCTRTYEYVWTTPTGASYINMVAVAKEGYENTVTASRSLAFSNCVDCPPVALNDSATGAGGAPLIMNVLSNDSDPNNNINTSSITIVTQPQNGNAIVSNGKVVYLPNGTFSGTDQFAYQVCDLTSPTPLCATAIGIVNIDPTIVDPCGQAGISHTYYVPYPEAQAQTALIHSTDPAYLPIPSNNMRSIISIKIPYSGMVLRWDHWEDGYEADILNPTQSTTVVWGDGNPYNGIAPGYPSDIIPAGGSIVLDNTMPVVPRVATNIFYDGRDKIVSSGEISMTQVTGEPSIISVQVMKTNITSTADFGTSFTIPAGENFNSQDFRYTALFIRASENNTKVSIDKTNKGSFDSTYTLNEGQSLLIDGGVKTGATITSTAPIGVDLHFGGVDGYSSREVPIFPATWYSNTYYTPVPTTKASDSSVVMLYNNLNRAITINWSSGAPASGTITLPAKTVIRYPLALSATSTYKFVNPTGESFTAIEIVDSYTPGGGGTIGSTYDWAFNMIAAERLTTFATIAWAPGSVDGTRNDNPIWVTPATNTTIYVKYNGNVLAGGSVSPCGFRYDVSYPLNALKYLRVLDNTDKDQSGIAIYTCDGTKIAAVYGEDPSTAQPGYPSWDVGTTIKPYCVQKLIFANDDYAYTLTDRAVTIPVLNNDAGFSAVVDPATISVAGLLAPRHGTVVVNSNGTLLYKPNPSYIGSDTLQYSVCSTPIPVCDYATVYIKINGCPSPANQNIISGQVFSDLNKDGISNDGGIGFPGAKVYFYIDANCNATIDANELRDSVVVDSSGGYQFITYPERTIADNFDNTDGTASCAAGTDGNTSWASNWVDAGDASTGFCVTPALSYSSTDVEMIKDGSFSNALRLKDKGKSASRTFNISGATAAFISFKYRKAKTTITTGKDIYVQASINGSSYGTLFTISGNGLVDSSYVDVKNLDILPYAGTNTIIRFLTNNNLSDGDEVFIDDIVITYLKYPICYMTALDQSTVSKDYDFSTATKNNFNISNGGVCLYPYDFGVARKIITVSGNLYNDVNGLTDGLVNGLGSSGPAGNTIYAYLVSATTGKILFKTTVNGLTGAYSFTRAEVNTNYTVVLTTTDAAVGATAPAAANLPVSWVAVGDSYGINNQSGTGNQTGTPDLAIPVNSGLFDVTGVNFGINQRPTAGNGSNQAINPGGTLTVTVPANSFSNIVASTDPSPGIISSIRISAFPTNTTTIIINAVSYTAATFPAGGVTIPATTTGQPTQTILLDPLNGMVKVTIPFFAIDNAGVESSVAGNAVLQMLIDTDKDGIPDNIDIDDDNDGIPDVIEICYNGATNFSCAPGGIDPGLDSDGDGIVNWQDPDYGALNAAGCTASLDRDGDGIPDHLDRDSDNDGIPDVVEAYGADADGDGVIDNFTDTDGDGLSQNVDNNNTGAAGSGNGLGFQDLDGDGFSNPLDLDSDNDGTPDITEVQGVDANKDGRVDNYVDSDGDGYADALDGDANNDFVIENINGPLLKTGAALSTGRPVSYPFKNPDQTGRPNPYDLDSDGDGITDIVESGLAARVGISNGQASGGRTNGWANSVSALASLNIRNSDGRGPEDYLDIDSDDDGITDNIEAQSTNGYIVPTDADADGDGIADVYDISVNSYGGNGLTPYDNDGDGTPDYLDLDSDNDGAPDLNEASRYFTLTQANINSVDTDGDGLLDEFDMLDISSLSIGSIFRNVTNSNFGPLGNYDGPLPSGSNAKMVKSDAKMNDRDWRNIVVLPIQITSFNGVYQNELVTLKWNVENEHEVDHYEIERSDNGIGFGKIASVSAFNQNNYNYTYPDDISNLFSTYVYYRLRQVNKNGQSSVTSVIKWKIESKRQQPVLYPNPVQNDLKVKFFATDNQVAEVIILDAGGRSVLTTRLNLIRGQNILTLPNVGRLNKGMYYLKFHSGLDTWMLKFLVQ